MWGAYCMDDDLNPLGYNALIQRYKLDVLPPWRESWLAPRGERKTSVEAGRTTEIYPPRYDPGASLGDHLTFALKNEGVNLEVLAALFSAVSADEISAFIQSQPTGKYARLTWFLYEWLTGETLPVDDLHQGNYIPVLDPESYYTLSDNLAKKSRRQRVVNNLPGTAAFCPLVRRTLKLQVFEAMKLDEKAKQMVAGYPAEMLYRATQYLYTKETKSSFEIEREHPDRRRSARFVELLRRAADSEPFSREELVRLQKETVDARFALDDFRDIQCYVGQTIGPTREVIHFAAPKPEDLRPMMQGWMTCSQQMLRSDIHPVVTAAVSGFGFVFLHPFEDGNGRLHRYFIHYVLSAKHFTPQGLIFPVSATMLKQMPKYDEALEWFSRELMQHVEYRLDNEGKMTVLNETAMYYRYPDMTFQAERLFEFIQDTIDHELFAELEYLRIFAYARLRIQEAVDMPDRKLDLFVRFCLEGKGHLSKAKRKRFDFLTDEEIEMLEGVVRQEMNNDENIQS